MSATRCPGCGACRRKGLYVCAACWDQLPGWVRRALTKRDGMAHRRGAEFFEQLRQGRALAEIQIAP